jgi:hypothetical protein
MRSVVKTSLTALEGGWRRGFARTSFSGAEYDDLVCALAREPSSRMRLLRACSSGALHGELAQNFPIDAALDAIGILLGDLPRGTFVVARDQITSWLPPASIDYTLTVTRQSTDLNGVTTYTVAVPGAMFGNVPVQLLTCVSPLCSDFDLAIDGASYRHSVRHAIYASVASSAVVEIMRHVSTAVRTVKETCGPNEVHRLVITGYSLGATQALVLAMLLCDDSMQALARTMGIATDAFESTTVFLFAMLSAVCSADTCAYVRRARERMRVYCVSDPLDSMDHVFGALLPHSRAAVPHVYTLEEGGIYRVEAACAPRGAMFGVAAEFSAPWMPWNWARLARAVAQMVVVAASAHMLVEYRRKLRAIRDKDKCRK